MHKEYYEMKHGRILANHVLTNTEQFNMTLLSGIKKDKLELQLKRFSKTKPNG
jgi:hypothetical protein